MSVAFRRDVDEEHLEPRFEIPIPAGANLVTERGLAQIERRVAHYEAAILGERDAAILATLQRDLRYWRVRSGTARIAPPPPPGEIAIGSRARISWNGEPRTIEIVGGDEADSAGGRVAFSAPLARALIGAGVGDVIDFAGKPHAITILEIGGPGGD